MTDLFLLTFFVVSKICVFTLSFSFCSCLRGAHDTTNHFTMISALESRISFLVFDGFGMTLFLHPIFVLLKKGVMSHFLPNDRQVTGEVVTFVITLKYI